MDIFDNFTTIKKDYPPDFIPDIKSNYRRLNNVKLFFMNKYPSLLSTSSHDTFQLKRNANQLSDYLSPSKILKIESQSRDKGNLSCKNGMFPEIEINMSPEQVNETEMGNLTYSDAYIEFQSQWKEGKPHPYPTVESRSLANIKTPKINYSLSLPKDIIKKGILSNVQLEAVVYACQKHNQYLDDNYRAGFLIGDGAGVGKGRTVAAIIFENYLKGKKRAIWLSVSNDLKEDAIRDLNDIGREIDMEIEVKTLNKMSYMKIDDEKSNNFQTGVLFSTYSSLISVCKKKDEKLFKSRFDQIVDWFGEKNDGVIIFDECHKAKNLEEINKTQTGTIVKRLQSTLKQARIVYASATGASEPKHMAYMLRLGLWGSLKRFRTFDEFKNTLNMFGVAAMELIAIEMKMKGVYLARQLSFKDVIFETRFIEIDKSTISGHPFKLVYNNCVKLWNTVHESFTDALNRNKISDRTGVVFQSQFWSSHQRFFKYLCLSGKIQECIRIATDEIVSGKCVVIGLQSTGESRTMGELDETFGELSEYVSSAKGVIKNLVENFYPSQKNLNRIKLKQKVRNATKISKTQNQEQIEEISLSSDEDILVYYSDYDCENKPYKKKNQVINESEEEEIQQKLLQLIKDIEFMLPVNILDELIREFGGPDFVAEMTGRKGRIIEENGKISFHSRKETGICADQINLLEKDRFNNGSKLIAIISDAASTGISLHSDKRFQNQRQRVHLTLELPWSADKAVQQFGRTHRSNQVIPPHYIYMISDLAGERRFAATVAKRLESLGALTHGDRRCADNSDLSQFNLDNNLGSRALQKMLNHLFKPMESVVPYPNKYLSIFNFNLNAFRSSAAKALLSVGIDDQTKTTVKKFLNRILGIELDVQNAIFQYFFDIVTYESQQSKLLREFDHGIRDIKSDGSNKFFLKKMMVFRGNQLNNTEDIILNDVEIFNTGVSWQAVVEKYIYDSEENMFCVSTFNSIRQLVFAEYMNNDKYKIVSPNFPEQIIDRVALQSNYERIDFNSVQEIWEHVLRESKYKCLHVISEQSCATRNCTFGKRNKITHIITGSVFLALKIIHKIDETRLEIIRITLNDGTKLIGAYIPSNRLGSVIEALEKFCNKKNLNSIKKK